MKRIQEALLLWREKGLNQSQIAAVLGLARSSVQNYMQRFEQCGLSLQELRELSPAALEKHLFVKKAGPVSRPLPDFQQIHHELSRPGVTRRLLWEEYRESTPEALGFTQFCTRYSAFARTLPSSMRQEHKGGEKLFVDYSGKRPVLHCPTTGTSRPVELFVMAWGASHFLYLEAQESQSLSDWIYGHIRAFDFFGCVPHHLVPDNLKSAVQKAHRYDPDLNTSYVKMCHYYGCAVLPARPYHPKDKAKVEVAVQVVQRWVLARLRDRMFHTLGELNAALWLLRDALNQKIMRQVGQSRSERFLALDKPHALLLPQEPYEYLQWYRRKVGIDYCVELSGCYYSVPFTLIGQELDLCVRPQSVEVFQGLERVALHPRLQRRQSHSLLEAHMPPKHQKALAWTPHRLLSWAKRIGPSTAALVEKIIASQPQEVMGYRPALGVLRLAEGCEAEKMELLSRFALKHGILRVSQLQRLVKMPAERLQEGKQEVLGVVEHENLRGLEHYESQSTRVSAGPA